MTHCSPGTPPRRRPRIPAGAVGLVFALALAVLCCAAVRAEGPAVFPNCRLGVAMTSPPLTDYIAYEQLKLGAYVDFAVHPPDAALPPGIEYLRTIRMEQVKLPPSACPAQPSCPRCSGSDPNCYSGPTYRDCYQTPVTYTLKSPQSFDALRGQVAANPGALWLVGNEPDRRSWPTGDLSGWDGQDEMTPELYARAYCEIRREIRRVDPGAQTAIAGMVQGTPLRLKYLDRVWAEYPKVCGGRRLGDDVDVWNVHAFVLREAALPCYCNTGETWGAEVPAGLSDCAGRLYSAADNGSLTYLKQEIVDFRRWMRDKGVRNRPLIVTEGGVNLGTYWLSTWQVKSIMNGMLDYVLNQRDSSLGYPIDGNRLVQQFLWWSMDTHEEPDEYGYTMGVDSLYDPGTHARLEYGNNWVAYVRNALHSEAVTPRVNLLVTDTKSAPAVVDEPTGPVTLTLKASVYNTGNTRTATGSGVVVRFRQGTPAEPGALIGARVITDVRGCGREVEVDQPWRIDLPELGAYPWYAEAVPISGEERVDDNWAAGVALVAKPEAALPVIYRNSE